MVDDTDPRIVWRGIGRGLDRCYPPENQEPDSIADLLEALRQRDRRNGDTGGNTQSA